MYLKVETISAKDANSNMPFLRNEFLKIFEDVFLSNVGDILDFDGCKMSSRTDFKTLWPHNGHADSLGVKMKKDVCEKSRKKPILKY